ncbi:hypothetical protein BH11MYX1_BH11MYX1_26590 [soil metagenome]
MPPIANAVQAGAVPNRSATVQMMLLGATTFLPNRGRFGSIGSSSVASEPGIAWVRVCSRAVVPGRQRSQQRATGTGTKRVSAAAPCVPSGPPCPDGQRSQTFFALDRSRPVDPGISSSARLRRVERLRRCGLHIAAGVRRGIGGVPLCADELMRPPPHHGDRFTVAHPLVTPSTLKARCPIRHHGRRVCMRRQRFVTAWSQATTE